MGIILFLQIFWLLWNSDIRIALHIDQITENFKNPGIAVHKIWQLNYRSDSPQLSCFLFGMFRVHVLARRHTSLTQFSLYSSAYPGKYTDGTLNEAKAASFHLISFTNDTVYAELPTALLHGL